VTAGIYVTTFGMGWWVTAGMNVTVHLVWADG